MDATNDPGSVPPSDPTPPPAPAPVPLVPVTPMPPPAPAAPAPQAGLPHSGLGIASMIMAIIVALGIFVVVAIAGLLHNQGRGPRDPMVMLVGLLTMLMVFFDLVALGLGIGAVCQKHRRKLFGIIGLSISGCVLLGSLGLMALGLALQHRS